MAFIYTFGMSNDSFWMLHIGIGQFIFYTVPFLLLGNHFSRDPQAFGTKFGLSQATIRRAYRALLVVTLLAAVLMVGRILCHTILVPPGWDFQGLWLYGKVVDTGSNPYLPSSFPPLAGPGPFVVNFPEEVLNVGAVYPPPSLLMFAAIGWLPMRIAIVPWMLVQTVAFVGMIILLRRTFFVRAGWEEWACLLTLSLLLPGTIDTFGHAQVNFIAVLCVMAAWRSRERPASGVYLVVASVMKLLYGFLWLYPLLRRRLKPLIGIAVAGAIAVIAPIAIFGWKVFASYLFDNPVTHRMPSYYFTFFLNQSLLGESYRLFPYPRPPLGPPVGHPVYIVSALVIGLLTIWAVMQQPRNSDGEDTAFILLLLAGMLIYPWTLTNYFVLLLVPMGYLWIRRNRSFLGVGWTIVLLSAIYPITYFRLGLYSFWATMLLWLTTFTIAVRTIRAARGREGEPDMRTIAPAVS